jgi:tetratricopeptide (TPR) repeat protein
LKGAYGSRSGPSLNQFTRSFLRAELRLARGTAETLLREAEEGGYATEAGVARRSLGLTCLMQGDLTKAQTFLEQTLADYAPSDAQTCFRFGLDTGAHATAVLAMALWHLGELERARRLAEKAVLSAAELGHAPTSTIAYLYMTFLDARRDDPAAALRSAETTQALGREHAMKLFAALGEIACWLGARSTLRPGGWRSRVAAGVGGLF